MTAALISISSRVVLLPPALLPVTVYTAALVTVVGVPLITPDCGSSRSPAGSLGATVYCVMAPPLLLGTFGMMATPLVYTTEVSRYLNPGAEGAGVASPLLPPLLHPATSRTSAIGRLL